MTFTSVWTVSVFSPATMISVFYQCILNVDVRVFSYSQYLLQHIRFTATLFYTLLSVFFSVSVACRSRLQMTLKITTAVCSPIEHSTAIDGPHCKEDVIIARQFVLGYKKPIGIGGCQ